MRLVADGSAGREHDSQIEQGGGFHAVTRGKVE
jgi:hypothetical protein